MQKKSPHGDHPNPDKLLPAKFKGIPEEMRILQFTDGGNNLAGSKSVSPNRLAYEEKTIYTYNVNGYPADAVTTFTQAGNLTTKQQPTIITIVNDFTLTQIIKQ